MKRKKQFEYRRNCSNRNDGMKLKALERGHTFDALKLGQVQYRIKHAPVDTLTYI